MNSVWTGCRTARITYTQMQKGTVKIIEVEHVYFLEISLTTDNSNKGRLCMHNTLPIQNIVQ